MKKFALVVLLTCLPAFANAAWMCRAESNNGWGAAIKLTQHDAANSALYSCALNTPYWDACFIVWCRIVY